MVRNFWLLLFLAGCSGSSKPVMLVCPVPEQGCVLQQVNGKDLRLRFSETPKPLHPFELELKAQADSIEASFQMQGMEMGLNRYRLLPENGRWHARVILPACIRARSDWVLELELKTAGVSRRYQLPFNSL